MAEVVTVATEVTEVVEAEEVDMVASEVKLVKIEFLNRSFGNVLESLKWVLSKRKDDLICHRCKLVIANIFILTFK